MATVEYEKKSNHLVIITMNRPDRLNAIDEEMLTALRESWIRYYEDDDAWIAIFTGAGRAFTAGADKSWFQRSLKGQCSPETFLNLTAKDPYWSGQLGKPVITAINGLAVGAGLDLTLRSDLRVASESAWFQQPEVERGTFMLFFDNLPYALAAEMTSGFRIPAKRAYEVGMINRVVPDGTLMDAALEMADEMLSRVPLALYHALKTLRDMKNGAALVPRKLIDHYTTVLSKDLLMTDDFKEATASQLEKRKPVFKRR
jgi:enoyl-CoA hydratase/carnithine racemase